MTFVTSTTSDVGRVRLYIGDTDSADQQLQDDAIELALDSEGDVRPAAALCAEWLAGTYARKADLRTGSLAISYSQRYEHYTDLAKRLRAGMAVSAVPYAGGISLADKANVESDSDRVPPAFTVTMLDNPEVADSPAAQDEENS